MGECIGMRGTVLNAELVVIEGTLAASMMHAGQLVITPTGMFRGEVATEDAEVAGLLDGTLTVQRNLIVRSTGTVLGTARCRKLQVEEGGRIIGHLEMIGSLPHDIQSRLAQANGKAGFTERATPATQQQKSSANMGSSWQTSGMDFNRAKHVRQELGIDGLKVSIAPSFDDAAFSRQVLGLQD